jgi:hypothetical protein
MDEQILHRFGEKDKENPEQYLRRAQMILNDETYAEWHSLLTVMVSTRRQFQIIW